MTSYRTALIAFLVLVFSVTGLVSVPPTALAQAPAESAPAEATAKKKKKKRKKRRKKRRGKKKGGDLNAAKARFQEGLRLEASGDLPGAIGQFKEALQLYPTFPLAHNELGVILAGRGDLVGATKELMAAVAQDPDFGAAWANLAEVSRHSQNHDVAIESYGQTLRLDRNDANAWYGLAAALMATQRQAESLAASKAFLALAKESHPQYANTLEAAKLLDAAGIKESLPDLPTAAPEFVRTATPAAVAQATADTAATPPKKGPEVLPEAKRGPYRHHKGDAAYQAARYVQALASYREELKSRPDDSELLYKVGATYAVMGDYRKASRWWARGLSVAPDRALLLRHATLAQLTNTVPAPVAGTEDKGPSPLERARTALLQNTPSAAFVALQGEVSDEAVYLRAESLLRLGRLEEAAGAFNEALRLLPTDSGPLGGLAETLMRLGKNKAAAPHRKTWLEGTDEPDETFLLKRSAAAMSRIAYGPASADLDDEDDL